MKELEVKYHIRRVLLYAILLLFFFELLTDFIKSVYAFGLLGVDIPPELVFVLFLFAPALLLLLPKALIRPAFLSMVGLLVVIARLVEAVLPTRSSMLVAGIGTGMFLIYLPAWFAWHARKEQKHPIVDMGIGLLLAVALAATLRVLGSGVDLATQDVTQVAGWVLAIPAVVLLFSKGGNSAQLADNADPAAPAPTGRVAMLCLGLMAVFVLLYYAFVAPTVIARWTGYNETLIVGLEFLGLVLFAMLITFRARWIASLSPDVVSFWNIVLVAALTLSILPHQMRFPADPSGYPLPEAAVHPLWVIPLVVMLLIFPVMILDFIYFGRELLNLRPSHRRMAGGFSLAALYLLVAIFAHVFTTVYSYIPVVGPLFRDKFWMVYMLAGAVLTLPLLRLRRAVTRVEMHPARQSVWMLLVFGIVALLGSLLSQPQPVQPAPGADRLRVLTYNIQQGYSQTGQENFDGQLAVIRGVQADVIGLQETDTDRLAGGNSDIVGYLANGLNMNAYFAPKSVTGTFGLALLSHYPIQSPRTFFMYSLGEQTAAIQAQIVVDGVTYNVIVTHLGNGGPIVQQEAVLTAISGLDNVILVGDFNFRPDTEQYRLTTQSLADAWLLRWPSGMDDQGNNPLQRIDQAFVTPGMRVLDARFINDPASNHPALWLDIGVGD